MKCQNLIFIIYAPVFTKNSAGIYALYKLAKDLNDNGQIAFITIWGNSNFYIQPIFGVPIIPNIITLDIIKCQNVVVVYPEVTSRNPLNAKHIVRWVMNKPGCFGVGDLEFDKNEKIFTFGKVFNKYITNNDIAGEITPILIDTDLFFYDKGIEKTDITVYTGKQQFREGFIDKYDNLITRTSPSHEEVAKILKRTKVLYTFDCITNIMNEARLCGCEVVYILNDQQKNDIQLSEFGMYGLHSYDEKNQLKYDYATISNAIVNKIKELNVQYLQQLDKMVNLFKNETDDEKNSK